MVLLSFIIVLIYRTDAENFFTNINESVATDVFARGSFNHIETQYLMTITLNHSAHVTLPLIFSIENVEKLQRLSLDDENLQRASLLDIATLKSLSVKSGDGECIEANKGDVIEGSKGDAMLDRRFCIYRFGGHVNITSIGLPLEAFEILRYRLQIVVTDHKNNSVNKLLVVNAVEECFPMSYYYLRMSNACPQDTRRFTSLHEDIRWPQSNIKILVNSGSLLGKIHVRTNFTTLFSNGNYTIMVKTKTRNYLQLFEYRRYKSQSNLGKRSAFFPRVHGKEIDIFFTNEIFLGKEEVVALSISSNEYSTDVEFYSEQAITLFGSSHLDTCPGSDCMSSYKKWKRSFMYLTKMGSVECTGDPNMFLSFLSDCKESLSILTPAKMLFRQKISLKCHGASEENADRITWLKNGQHLDGKTGSNLELSGLDFMQQGFYQCQLIKHEDVLQSGKVLVKFQDVIKTWISFEMTKSSYNRLADQDGRFNVDVKFKSKSRHELQKLFGEMSHACYFRTTNWYHVQFIANSQLKPNATSKCIYEYLRHANRTEILHPFEIRENSFILHDNDVCLPDMTGELSSYGEYVWNYSRSHTVSKQPCRNGNANVTRKCAKNDVNQFSLWMLPNTSGCEYTRVVTRTLDNLLKNISQDQNAYGVTEALRKTNILLENKTLSFDDTAILEKILKTSVNSSIKITDQVAQSILGIVDNVIKGNTKTLVAAQEKDRTLNSIIRSVEYTALKLQTNSSSRNTSTELMQVSSADVTVAAIRNIGATSSQDLSIVVQTDSMKQPSFSVRDDDTVAMKSDYFVKVQIPKSVIPRSVNLVYYTSPALFPCIVKTPFGDEIDESKKVIGGVLGVLLNKQANVHLPKNFVYEIKMDDGIEEDQLQCVFWDFQANGNRSGGSKSWAKRKDGLGNWSMRGCKKIRKRGGKSLACSCNHLTNFAVLFDAGAATSSRLDKRHNFALSLITYVGCALSLTGILLTMVTLCLFKFLRRNTPSKVLLCLCGSLGLMMIIFVSLVERTKPRWLCTTTSILLHYFVLTTFGWMLVEAFTLYLKVVKITGEFSSRFLIKASLATTGLPVIVVVCCFLLRQDDYTRTTYCIATGMSLYYGLLVPVCLVLFINIVIFILVVYALHKSRRKTQIYSQGTSLVAQFRIAVSCCTLLGLTWLFGIFAISDARLPFQYAFCILNSFQGGFIFYFNIVRQSRVREAWKNYFSGHGTSYEPNTLSTASRLKIVNYSEAPTFQSLELHNNEAFDVTDTDTESYKPELSFTSFVERSKEN